MSEPDKLLQQKIIDFVKQFPPKRVEKGKVFLSPQKVFHGAYVTFDGYIQFYSINKNAKKISLGYIKPGTFFPVSSLFEEPRPTRYYYKSLSNLTLYFVPQKELIKFCIENPEAMIFLSYGLFDRLLWYIERLAKTLELNAYGRTCSSLLLLLEMGVKKTSKGQEIITKMTQDELATFTGLTRENLNIQIAKLVKEKIIIYKRKTVTILNQKYLEEEIEYNRFPSHSDIA